MATATKPQVIGVLGLGAMGAGVAADLRTSGFTVVSALEGRSAKTRERAEKAGVKVLANLDAVVAAADTFLSIVPADQAEPLAEAIAQRLKGKALHYVECNSITPSKTLRIAQCLTAAGAIVSDGGIIGPPPGGRSKTHLYVSGPHAEILSSLQSEAMPVRRLGASPSQATEMKVLFSAANKGAVALLANVLAAARSVGLQDNVVDELDQRVPGLLGCLRHQAPDLGDKAARWAVEMDDLAAGLAEMHCHPGYHTAAGDSYRQVAANLEGVPPSGDALSRVLAAWVGKASK
ncbi:MAG: NAD(P)-binding domain-containing protein [Hyphomicrobiaceae bacterium]